MWSTVVVVFEHHPVGLFLGDVGYGEVAERLGIEGGGDVDGHGAGGEHGGRFGADRAGAAVPGELLGGGGLEGGANLLVVDPVGVVEVAWGAAGAGVLGGVAVSEQAVDHGDGPAAVLEVGGRVLGYQVGGGRGPGGAREGFGQLLTVGEGGVRTAVVGLAELSGGALASEAFGHGQVVGVLAGQVGEIVAWVGHVGLRVSGIVWEGSAHGWHRRWRGEGLQVV